MKKLLEESFNCRGIFSLWSVKEDFIFILSWKNPWPKELSLQKIIVIMDWILIFEKRLNVDSFYVDASSDSLPWMILKSLKCHSYIQVNFGGLWKLVEEVSWTILGYTSTTVKSFWNKHSCIIFSSMGWRWSLSLEVSFITYCR